MWLNLRRGPSELARVDAGLRRAKARLWSHNRPDDVGCRLCRGSGRDAQPRRCARSHLHVRRRRRRLPTRRVDVDRSVRRLRRAGDDEPRSPARRHQRVGGSGDRDRVGAGRGRGRRGLGNVRAPPHRIEPVGEFGGARWYNDSKATTPHAAITAIRGFAASCCWPAGATRVSIWRHGDRARTGEGGRRARGVSRRSSTAFAPWCPSSRSARWGRRRRAAEFAEAGDTVLLSPAVPASTGIPTVATRHAAMISSGWCRATSRTGRTMTLIDPGSATAVGRPSNGGRAGVRRAKASATRRMAIEASLAADGRVLCDRRRGRRVRHARPGDGAVGVVDQPVPPRAVALPHLQQAGDVGRDWGWWVCGSGCACRTTSGADSCSPALIVSCGMMLLPFVPGIGTGSTMPTRGWRSGRCRCSRRSS